MERRSFLRLSAYTAAVLGLSPISSCSPGTDDPLALPKFFSHLVDVKSIKEVGKAYRKLVPAEDDHQKLSALLRSNQQFSNNENLQRLIDLQVNSDFKTNRTVTVSGWVLAITEARQCALFSIVNS